MLEDRLKRGLNENFNSEDEDDNPAASKKHKGMTEEEIIVAKSKGDGYLNPR